VLLAVGVAAFGLPVVSATAARVQVRITKWEANTVQHHSQTVSSGASLTFCASDPYYAVSPFFTWRGVPFSAVMTLTVSQPRLKTTASHSKTFAANGQNAYTFDAFNSYGPSAKSIPAGRYSFDVTVAGAKASGSITLVETPNCP
jgi:hypothetical protein